ncbi:3-oxoacyl-ACP reductase FabG [Suttonella sp. R2A3]|uniref:3-oxoacyl-ACP reductase FabG n=1 Tax=Suttonella sp. R2A3 TaxID=2908648 RepID=UPI001F3DD527|nr:3-oxoacyl-ACP reductase FabG [Suttonella sp. R2A3]UJF24092.1 3-oxoacyl-ACP reductase FabG [Suttonella sp. R2A3]
MNIDQQIVLITGASRGIGRGVLDAFATRGATVIGTATSESGAQAISQHIADNGWRGTGMALRVNDQEAIDAAIKSIREQFGALTTLINNAGITEDNLLMRMKPEQWDAVIDTNLNSVYRLSKAVMRDMMKTRFGRIITITSVVGVMGNAGQTNYAASKAGVIGFSKSLAREIGSRGITVNTIAPGCIATDMTEQLPEAQKQQLIKDVPMAKLGAVEDIADAAVFLAGAAYITGETLHVNGGMYMI